MDETDDRNRSNASLSKVILGAEHLMEFELSLVIIFLLKQKIGYQHDPCTLQAFP